MRLIIKSSLLAGAAISIGAAAIDMDNDAKPELSIKEIGEPQKCLRQSDIGRTEAIDEKTLEYTMRDGTIYRNKLLNNCGAIRNADQFSYELSFSGRLCRADRVSALDTFGSFETFGNCGLGDFQQIEKSAAE